ncbi:MAG: hypothetical protein Q9167_003050 [Letrouitia subvulpina]
MAFFFLLCLGLRESRPSILLEQYVSIVRELEPGKKLLVRNPDKVKDLRTLIRITLIRPLRLLCTEPIIMIVSFIGSVVNTIFYLFVEAFPVVYDDFGFSERQASLIFVGIGVGLCFGFFPRMYDRHIIKIRQKKGQVLEPEDKLFGFALATPVLAVSFWWFAWTVPPYSHTSWVVSALALVPAGFALNELCYTLEGYLADSYTIYAASAFAGFSLSRSLVGAVVMPFAHQMYSGLSANIASSILASVATCFCAASYVLIRHGYEIRGRSAFAKYSLEVYQQNQIGDDMNLAHAAS